MPADLLPDTLITISDCIVDRIPDRWIIDDREAMKPLKDWYIDRFTISAVDFEATKHWANEALVGGTPKWPGVFVDLEDAMRVRKNFLKNCEDLIIVGVALASDYCQDFLDDTRMQCGNYESGVSEIISKQQQLSRNGTVLGFDILAFHYDEVHNVVCNSDLVKEIAEKHSITPNGFGLYDDLSDANTGADYCNLETTGADEGLWLPWRIVRY